MTLLSTIGYTNFAQVKLYGSLDTANDSPIITQQITEASRQFDRKTRQNLGTANYVQASVFSVLAANGDLICYPNCPAIGVITAARWAFPSSVPAWVDVAAPVLAGLQSVNNSRGCVVGFPGFASAVGLSAGLSGAGVIMLQLTFVGGYSAWGTVAVLGIAPPVPDDLEGACKRLVWWTYKKRDAPMDKTAIPELGIVTVPGGWPGEVMDTLKQYTWSLPI